MLDPYTDATPNGLKVSIYLEELGLKYDVHHLFLAGDQMTPEFAKLNPTKKFPCSWTTASSSPNPAQS